MGLLRFFFTDRYNRFDVAVVVVASVLYGKHQLGFWGVVAIAFVGFMLSSVGEHLQQRRAEAPDA